MYAWAARASAATVISNLDPDGAVWYFFYGAVNAGDRYFEFEHKLFARRRRFCFTYLLIYLLTYSPCYVLGKLFARVHRISVCVIVT